MADSLVVITVDATDARDATTAAANSLKRGITFL